MLCRAQPDGLWSGVLGEQAVQPAQDENNAEPEPPGSPGGVRDDGAYQDAKATAESGVVLLVAAVAFDGRTISGATLTVDLILVGEELSGLAFDTGSELFMGAGVGIEECQDADVLVELFTPCLHGLLELMLGVRDDLLQRVLRRGEPWVWGLLGQGAC